MDKLYVVRDTVSGMYYSDDKHFIEPEKKYAKKMRLGQAKAICAEQNRYSFAFNSHGANKFKIEECE